jgi:predicted AAA+ superfamily ATPase
MKNEDLLDYIVARLKETPKLSEDLIYRNNQKLKHLKVFNTFKNDIDNFLKGNYEKRFFIMPGLRGVGKTTLLFQLYEYLTKYKDIEQDRVLYLSADHLKEYLEARIIDTIDVFINEIHQKTPVTLNKELFIFIDEAQHDPRWSQAGKILYDQNKKIFFLFTGSSALEFELNVDTVRRSIKKPVYPLTFSEYLNLKFEFSTPPNTEKMINNLIFQGDEESLNAAIKIENQLLKQSLLLDQSLQKIWEKYLCCGGFPFGLYLDDVDRYNRTFNLIDRVVEKDVSHIRSFRTESRSTIFRILMFLALQKPGELSEAKLADRLNVSSALVKDILTILEKTHLIFPVKPYGGAGKTIRKPWKYYFLTPALKASINYKLGKYDPRKQLLKGILTENLVASTLFRKQETDRIPLGIFYPPHKGEADFLIMNAEGDIVPIEVGIGAKKDRQVQKSINKYNSKYGILISNSTSKITKKGQIIHIPLTTFSFF